MYDIAGLIAPRAHFVESCTEDKVFLDEATVESLQKAKRINKVSKVEDKVYMEIFGGEQIFYGKGAVNFLGSGSEFTLWIKCALL